MGESNPLPFQFSQKEKYNQAMKKYKKILTREFLIKKYSVNEQSAFKIAKQVDCARETVYNYLRKYNIRIRTLKESHADVSAENNPMFGKRGDETGNYKGDLAVNRQKYYCIDCLKNGIKTEITYPYKRCQSCAQIKLWQDLNHRNKMKKLQFEGRQISPNKPEKKLNALLNKLYPKEYKFVGDGEIILGGFNPDFINCNGQKKIIELYGDYWHSSPKQQKLHKRRIKTYAKYGYKPLIIWEKELKDLNKLARKIKEFV